MLLATLILIGVLLVAAYKKRYSKVENVNQGSIVFDDFLSPPNGTKASAYFTSNTTTGGAVVALDNGPYPGARQLVISSSATGWAELSSRLYMHIGQASGSTVDVQTRYTLSKKPDGSDSYVCSFGLTSSAAAIPVETTTTGVYFTYDTTLSNNWICVVDDGVNPATKVVTNVLAASGDTYLRILVSPSACFFWINNNLIASVNRSPPDIVVGATWGIQSTNAANSTAYNVLVDAVQISYNAQLARQFVNPVSQG